MIETVIVVKVTEAVAKTSLIESIRDGVVDFLVGQAKDLGKKELSGLIAKLRSDAKLRKQIQKATERAAERWASDYPDRYAMNPFPSYVPSVLSLASYFPIAISLTLTFTNCWRYPFLDCELFLLRYLKAIFFLSLGRAIISQLTFALFR